MPARASRSRTADPGGEHRSAHRLRRHAVTNRARGLVLDLSAVTFLDSTGLRLVFRLARRLRDRQQSLRLVVPEGARISRVLSLSGVAAVAEIVSEHVPSSPAEEHRHDRS